MSRSKLLAVVLVVVAMIGAPVAQALSFEAVALGLVALPGVVAAALVLDVRTRGRVSARATAAWQRSADKRLGELEQALERLPQGAQVSGPDDLNRAVQVITERIQAAEQTLERPPVRAGIPTHDDLIGTVRVIQAQYEGRLDRAQSSLDEAVRALRDQLAQASPGRDEQG